MVKSPRHSEVGRVRTVVSYVWDCLRLHIRQRTLTVMVSDVQKKRVPRNESVLG
jgi:hypothetical protein